jgi:hypothetical protein
MHYTTNSEYELRNTLQFVILNEKEFFLGIIYKLPFWTADIFSHFSFVLFQQNIFESFLVDGTRVRMTFE